MIDIALSQDLETGVITIHRADCPLVRQLADMGVPVMTMFGCKAIPDLYPLHSCMKAKVNGE